MLIVARGLIAEPRLFLLDEVAEGLQPSVVDRLAEALLGDGIYALRMPRAGGAVSAGAHSR
jgi:ABC-type phosphonate transport system ATPase subunit